MHLHFRALRGRVAGTEMLAPMAYPSKWRKCQRRDPVKRENTKQEPVSQSRGAKSPPSMGITESNFSGDLAVCFYLTFG
jgi:hypothetical protein